MKRREFITLVGGAIAGVPLPTHAQQATKLHRVAFVAAVAPLSTVPNAPISKAFIQGLRDLGYVEGINLIMEWRSAEGQFDRFPGIFQELLAIKVDVIVTLTPPMTRVVKKVTQTVPIVMISANLSTPE